MKINEEFKFINNIPLEIQPGNYKITATQSVNSLESKAFTVSENFQIVSRIFTIDVNDVFSAYPNNGETSDFSNVLPHINFKNKSYPWEYPMSTNDTEPTPCRAYITLSAGEFSEKEMSVKEILSFSEDIQNNKIAEKDKGIFFPPKNVFPKYFGDGEDDICKVIDIPVEIFKNIMPSKNELKYTVHAKMLNLADTEDKICAMDGYFSTFMSNRFPPYGNNSCHLVSIIGYGELLSNLENINPNITHIRLVSLYSLNFSCENSGKASIKKAIENLAENTGEVGYFSENTFENRQPNELEKQCYTLKKHITRTGEVTYSLYRSPLIAFKNQFNETLDERRTADGRLIYNKKTGVFDVSYAAAFQLGRLITLKNKSVAEKIIAFNRSHKQEINKMRVRENFSLENFDFKEVAEKMSGISTEAPEKNKNNGRLH